ncbi:MAG: SusD/RagB family nutrient-binding outer membrane lipoprotein [Chloroflexia bacterium]|nr:SusD/RagB family nutrient-binding outer membrane lipoprotein [Chloroflexia bacterium]
MFFGSSCQDFLEVNETNPNNPSKVAPKLLLPAALNSVATTMNNPRRFDFVYLWHGLWSISAGYSQPQALVQYRLTNSNYQNAFNEFFIAGQNLTEIENAAEGVPQNDNFKAIAMIMKVYIFQNLVDCWGDVPYFEAFKSGDGNLKPKYDDQQEIYEDLVVKLDEAMSIIANAPIDAEELDESSDIICGGNMMIWQKFANTLKLRILIHQSGMSGRDSYISTALATTSSIGYLGAGESVLSNPGYLVSAGK